MNVGTRLLHKRFKMKVEIAEVCKVFDVNHGRITIYRIGEMWCTKAYIESNYEVVNEICKPDQV